MAEAESNFKWYVMRAVSGKENKAKEYIEIEMKNSNLGTYVRQVLIPTEKVYQLRNGKKIIKERSYLPGYILIEADLSVDIQHQLRETPNILGFLTEKDSTPIPIRQSEVNRILGKVDELQESGEEMLTPFYVGESVKVISGPFSGFTGVIEDVNDAKRKLKVMVMIFGRKNPVELGFTQVEKE